MGLHNLADLSARYDRFVARVLETRRVWVLVDAETKRGAYVDSNQYERSDGDPVVVHLVYSAAAYAKAHASEGWESYVPLELNLDLFVNGPLSSFANSGELVGPDFNSDFAGLEVEPAELAERLRSGNPAE